MGLKTLSFDPTIITGWIQCHCEDYQILIPKTVHGSKLELERSRCHKNRDNTTIDAPLNSGSHNFWSDRWIFQFHTFLETWSEDLFKSIKINPITDHLKVAAFQEPLPRNLCQGYKKPRHPLDRGDHFFFFLVLLFTWLSTCFSPLPHTKNTKKKKKKPKKHIKPSWFFSLHKKHKVLFLYPIFFSLVLHLGFTGVDVAFLATIHTPNLLNLFLAFYPFFLLK